ncbi:tetratricopeptide repeat protein [Agaribacter flavus]|uniref:Tetratricopeptide repeat protein n=1 Tax=Agaribacter flavus TaxID=1902781 RepID=A0ABV7FQA0_9ALTE
MQEQEYIAKISALMTDGQLSDAQELISKAISIFPQNGFICFLKAAIHAQNQQFEQAKITYAQSLELAPDLHIARFQLGLLQATLEDYDNAINVLHPLLQIQHEYLPLFANALISVFQGNNTNAMISIEEGLKRNNDNPNLNKDMRDMLNRIKASENIEAKDERNSANLGNEQTSLSEKTEPNMEQDISHLLDIYDVKH